MEPTILMTSGDNSLSISGDYITINNSSVNTIQSNQSLIDVLIECRELFQKYQKYHEEKGTEDSLAKAKVNEQMVAKINSVL